MVKQSFFVVQKFQKKKKIKCEGLENLFSHLFRIELPTLMNRIGSILLMYEI